MYVDWGSYFLAGIALTQRLNMQPRNCFEYVARRPSVVRKYLQRTHSSTLLPHIVARPWHTGNKKKRKTTQYDQLLAHPGLCLWLLRFLEFNIGARVFAPRPNKSDNPGKKRH
ncbi:hypothetical protein CNMCM5878_008022 [Aspergillus fumigatiaffinis]|nr:hypothetical protein CNMCM5878_008022 [Aspergillus fumigatiaffinis]